MATWRGTFQNFIYILGDIQGGKCKCTCFGPESATRKQDEAVEAGDMAAELSGRRSSSGLLRMFMLRSWSINGLFDCMLESPRETFGRMFASELKA